MELSRTTELAMARRPKIAQWIHFMVDAVPEIMVDMLDAKFGSLGIWFEHNPYEDRNVLPPTQGCMVGTAAIIMSRMSCASTHSERWERDGDTILAEFLFACDREGKLPRFRRAMRKYRIDRRRLHNLIDEAGMEANMLMHDFDSVDAYADRDLISVADSQDYLDGMEDRTRNERAVACIKEMIVHAFANTKSRF